MRSLVFRSAACAGVGLVVAAASGPVEAQDASFKGRWTGFSAGIHAGAMRGDYFGAHDTAEIPLSFEESDSPQPIVGVHLAYDHQFERGLVLGVAIDMSFAFGDSEGPASVEGDVLTAKTDYVATAGVRAGWAFNSVMIYGGGGLAFVDYEAEINDNGVSAVADEGNAGVFISGGLQWRFSERLSLLAEGGYIFLDDENSIAGVTPDSDPGDRFAIDGVSLARVGVTYHF